MTSSIVTDGVHLNVEEAAALGERALRAIGYDAEQARITTAHLVDATMCGLPYAGLPRILTIYEDPRTQQPRTPLKIVHETPLSAMIDGGNNVGYFAVYKAAEIAIEKAKQSGIALVGIHRTHLSGRSGYYMEMAARAGFVGVHFASSAPVVLPHGGRKPAFGTNPIAFGFPTSSRDPFIVDLGTASMMRGDVILRTRTGEPLPEGVAIDASGAPTTDPNAALAGGGILPFGGHRGSALSFAVQALGVLAGAARTKGQVQDFAFLFMVIDPGLLLPPDELKAGIDELIEAVRAVPPLDAGAPVRIPSERAFAERERQRQNGIYLAPTVYERLNALIETAK
jgi:LDH2 family malate/lactate/ureidoglycolate dehydrogenase